MISVLFVMNQVSGKSMVEWREEEKSMHNTINKL